MAEGKPRLEMVLGYLSKSVYSEDSTSVAGQVFVIKLDETFIT